MDNFCYKSIQAPDCTICSLVNGYTASRSVPPARLVWLLVVHRQHNSKLRVELSWLMKALELYAVDCGPRIARLYLGC